MADNTTTNDPLTHLSNDELALERTILAEERTLMAWIRTSISLISFGFTIYKFFHETSKADEAAHRLLSPRLVGMGMILFGMLGLLLAMNDNLAFRKTIARGHPRLRRSTSLIMAVLIWAFGLLLFLGTVFRQ